MGIKLLDHVVLGDGCYATIGEDRIGTAMAAESEIQWVVDQ